MRQYAKYLIIIMITNSHLSFAGELVPSLFRAAWGQQGVSKTQDVTVKRQRFLRINIGLLNTEEKARQHDELLLSLFDDTTFVAKLERVETFSGNGVGWVGHLKSVEDSQVIFIIRNGQMTGNIVLPDALYKIGNDGKNGLHTIKEIKLSNIPPEFPAVKPKTQ
ncbi:MAG: hypothetical protein QM500_20495 [Methylococcales bacterium]